MRRLSCLCDCNMCNARCICCASVLAFGRNDGQRRADDLGARMPMRDEGAEAPGRWVAGIGESMAVLLPDAPGPLEGVGSFAASVGGAESNVARALSALGVPSAWVSRVGDDGFGRRLARELAARGGDPSGGIVGPAPPARWCPQRA